MSDVLEVCGVTESQGSVLARRTTGEMIGAVACCAPAIIDVAVEAAAQAFTAWRELLPLERGRMLRAWAGLTRAHADDLAVIMVAEQGKPRREALEEIAYAASFLDWFAAEALTVKKVSLELGGHAPFLLFSDAPLADAVKACIDAKFATSGQDCLAANRIYVQEDMYERFVAELGRATARLSRLVVGGVDSPLGGNFISPTVLADVTDEMLMTREETFGPVAAILPFRTESEVIARANASEMGLAAYVYTQDLARAMRTSDQLEFGMVAVNTASFTGAPIPFGGWKQSGLGREGSRHGLLEFMVQKYVCIGGLAA